MKLIGGKSWRGNVAREMLTLYEAKLPLFTAFTYTTTLHEVNLSLTLVPQPQERQDAAPTVLEHPTSPLSAIAPPRSTACFDRAAAPLTSTARRPATIATRRLWLPTAATRRHGREQLHAPGIWRLHERFDRTDGLPVGKERRHGWERIRGAERMFGCIRKNEGLQD